MDRKKDDNATARTATTPADTASVQKLPEVDPRTGMLKVPPPAPPAPAESDSQHPASAR
jgi:hypothetical protein